MHDTGVSTHLDRQSKVQHAGRTWCRPRRCASTSPGHQRLVAPQNTDTRVPTAAAPSAGCADAGTPGGGGGSGGELSAPRRAISA